jgi:4-amino-4-deoxy-L-arabinose transferase-like glycosyltransferase
LLVFAYLVLGFAYSIVNPILESPDELLNYQNIRFIAEERRLPVLQPGEFSKAHHPPLYYIIGAALAGWVPDENLDIIAERVNPFWGYQLYEPGIDNKSQYLHDPALEGWPYQDAALGIHLLRWASLLMGAGAVTAVYFIARELFPAELPLAWGTAALVAFNPMFLFIQSSVHNDALTNLLAALTILGVVRYWRRGPTAQRAAFIGIVAALGILSKITFLFLGPMVFLALCMRSWSHRHTNPAWRRELFHMLALSGGLVVAVAGWWFVRNQIIYGEPTSMNLQASIWQPRANGPDWAAAFGELDYLRDSFWGAFGFGQIPLHAPVSVALWYINLTAIAGLLLWAVREGRSPQTYRVPGLLIAILLIAPLTAFAATFSRMAISSTANFGRYLFTAYGVIAPSLILGLTEWIPRPWRRGMMAGLTAVFLSLGLYGLIGVLSPAYAPPALYDTAAEVTIPYPADVDYPDLGKLLGYSLSSTAAAPGEILSVTLYWQVTEETKSDYQIFLQLVDGDDVRVAGRDTHSGLGRYPTSRWQRGQIIADVIPLSIPEDAIGPTGLRLNVGLRYETGRLLPTADGHTTITLGLIRLEGSEAMLPPAQAPLYYLGDVVELIAVTEPAKMATPGATLPFTLTWATKQPPGTDYTVFIHLLDETGNLAATADGPPAKGAFPTHLWQTGDVVLDARQLMLPDDLPSGSYQVLAGLYRLDDLSRLPVTDSAGQPLPDNAIPIFTLTVSRSTP